MNILFLTLMEIKDFNQKGIYPDLINEFAEKGHEVYVVSPCEKKNKSRYEAVREKDNVHLVSALIPDYFGVNVLKKGYSSLVIGRRYLKTIERVLENVKFDLILFSTPPITFSNVIEKIKKRDMAATYLLLKDIWPQGPIDIGVLSPQGITGVVTKYFKLKETKLYQISDFIGCMSEQNCKYIIENNGINENKVEICPNSIKIRDKLVINKNKIREDYSIPVDKTIFVYGGNLGIAQGIDFIISCLRENEKNEESFILIIGNGTEYDKLERWINQENAQNCKLIPSLPQNEYKKVMAACDVGLIFLDHRFTIPNFPSRILSYMEEGLPVLAATDTSTDVGNVITEGEFGYWCESNNEVEFMEIVKKMCDVELCEKLGQNSNEYLKNHFNVEESYKTIIKHFEE